MKNCLPDVNKPNFIEQLVQFGYYLEKNIRKGSPLDLYLNPNPLWRKIEDKLQLGLNNFLKTKLCENQLMILQWYNSGIILKTSQFTLGLDIIPIPRFYSWNDRLNLTEQLAGALDALLITHEHQDHFDQELVARLKQNGKMSVIPHGASVVGECSYGADHLQSFAVSGCIITNHQACHVWRNNKQDVATSTYELELFNGFRLVFCGDSDYTRDLAEIRIDPDFLFITWRNPGPEYEQGHYQQKGTTLDALNVAIKKFVPQNIILEHYAELDHIYKGFEASYDLAAKLISRSTVPADILFWGDTRIYSR